MLKKKISKKLVSTILLSLEIKTLTGTAQQSTLKEDMKVRMTQSPWIPPQLVQLFHFFQQEMEKVPLTRILQEAFHRKIILPIRDSYLRHNP